MTIAQSCTGRGLHSIPRYRSIGELLPPLSILADCSAVCFCCTFLEVASTGRYPALLLCGARTFLVSFPTQPFGCLLRRKCTTFFAFCQRMKAQGRLLCPEPTFFAVCSRFTLVQKQTFQLLAWRLARLFKIFIVQYNSFTAYFEKTFSKCRSVVVSFSKKIFSPLPTAVVDIFYAKRFLCACFVDVIFLLVRFLIVKYKIYCNLFAKNLQKLYN